MKFARIDTCWPTLRPTSLLPFNLHMYFRQKVVFCLLLKTFEYQIHMWQSQVEIEHYLLRISTVLLRSKRCRAVLLLRAGLIPAAKLCQCLISLHSAYEPRSTALQCSECGNAVEICNGIMFDFYPGLPHI